MKLYWWARQREDDRHYRYILHDDWIIGNVQFSYRHVDEGVFRLVVREQRGWFGHGCSDWYVVEDHKTRKEVCDHIRRTLKLNNELYWHTHILEIDQSNERAKKQELENKFCGFGSKKAIGFGYQR